MSSLSELFPAGAGKEVSFVASGTIATGDTVILNSDGTVTSVSGQNYAAGTQGDASTTSGDYTASAFDANSNKVVVSWENGGNSYAAVGTVSGSSISFGSPVQYLTNRNANYIRMTFDSGSNKVIFVYRDDGTGANNYGQAIVGNVSGTSISFGAAYTFISATIYEPSVVYDSTNNKSVIFYKDALGNGKALVASVSGTSMSFGSTVQFDTSNVQSLAGCFDSNAGKVVLTYGKSGVGNQGTAIVGTVSGTSISFGSSVSWSSAARNTGEPRPTVFDSTNNKVVIIFIDNGTTVAKAIVGTVSGTSISFGDEVESPANVTGGTSDTLGRWSATFDPDTQSVVFNIRSVNGIPFVNTFKVSGESGLFGGTYFSLESISTNFNYTTLVYDTNADKAVLSMQNYTNSSRASSFVFTVPDTNVTDDNFLGISKGATSNAASGSITIKGGVSSNVSGLTPNTTYYVQYDGSLGTSSTGTVLAGRALSATSIDLDYST